MMKARLVIVALLSLAVALPAFGKTYKSTYPVACSELWPAVKDTLGNPDNHYDVVAMDDSAMHAEYDVRHAAHVTITGAILQRINKVTLVPQSAGCEMQVVSNYSGWEHNDREDFKKRVDDALAKLKETPPQPAKPESPAQ